MATQKRTTKKTAIEAERGTVFRVDPKDVQIVGFDTKHKRGEHPLWQSRALEPVDESLAQAMAVDGFTTVIDVRKDGPNLEVVAGRRRVKAARRANEIRSAKGLPAIKISVQIKRGDNVSMMGLMISENALRKDVHPLDMAADLQQYLNIGASEETAARSIGKTITHLRAMLKLLDLDPTVQTAIRKGTLSATAGMRLADLTRDAQKAELQKIQTGETDNTVAAVASVVRVRKEGAEDSSEAVVAPGKRLLNKIVASEEAQAVFGPQGLLALRFAMGDISPRQIKGLTELLRKLEAAKPTK